MEAIEVVEERSRRGGLKREALGVEGERGSSEKHDCRASSGVLCEAERSKGGGFCGRFLDLGGGAG